MTGTNARALWISEAGRAELKDTAIIQQNGDLPVKTLFSGISRGTERLVFEGRVPETEHETMRAPFQEGAFTFPIKYGYSSVGEIQAGPRAGERIFALFPHQDVYCLPAYSAVPVPDEVPSERAVVAANMETALTILWDSGASAGDRIVVIGAGVVGALVGYLSAQMPGSSVCLVDIDPERADLARHLGCEFATPDEASDATLGEADVVIHASASSAGLATAIALAGVEVSIVEASWYGTQTTEAPLGGRFHQRRLRIIGSQVGRIPAHKAARWTYRRRLTKALELLGDPRLDHLMSGETSFDDLARDYGSILRDPATLCHRVRYD